jgi:isocitrate lyase
MSSEAKVSYDLKRFLGIKKDYTPEEVERLRGSIKIEYSMCKHQSKKLWDLLNSENYINTLGSLSGNHAIQHAKAGLKAIYLSGWQVAADANTAGEMYPDQSLYPYDSAPKLVESMNNALIRADQIQHMELHDGDMKIICYQLLQMVKQDLVAH